MSDVLDLDMPEYVIEEDKSKQTHILISKKNVRAALVDEKQSAQQPEEVKNPYDPYDDELEQQFYQNLPDFKRFYEAAQTALNGFSDAELLEASKKAETQFEEMTKKIMKSQSKYQIDQRAEECMKRFSGP